MFLLFCADLLASLDWIVVMWLFVRLFLVFVARFAVLVDCGQLLVGLCFDFGFACDRRGLFGC